MSAGENFTSDDEAKMRHQLADQFKAAAIEEFGLVEPVHEAPQRETTSAELKDATTAPSEYSMSGTWGEFAARMNSMPLDQREAWFHHHDEAQRRAQNCMLSDHERQIKFYEGRSVEADKLNDRLIKIIGDKLPLAGVDATTIQAKNDEFKTWIEKYSDAMPGEEWFSHNIDGSEEEEIFQFIQLMTDWYMTVMKATDDSELELNEVDLMYNTRFQFNPETQEFTRVSDEGNIWHTCAVCKGPIRYNDAPTGGWWSHAEHPHDDHDAEISA